MTYRPYPENSPPLIKNGYNENGEYRPVIIKYYGVPVSEYNPQFWDGSIIGEIVGQPLNWYEILKYPTKLNETTSDLTVFDGWEVNGEKINPGTDLRKYANSDKRIDLTACWTPANQIKVYGYVYDNIQFKGGSKYSNLFIFGDSGISRVFPAWTINGAHDCTIRSVGSKGIEISGANLKGNVIIDNVNLVGDKNSTNHGNKKALYAGGSLILGTGIETVNNVQVYGGLEERSKEDGLQETDLRIFSGKYATVFGGSYDGSVKSTNLVLAGRYSDEQSQSNLEITDTVYGGSCYDDNSQGKGKCEGAVGSTNVLFVGGKADKEIDGNDYSAVVGGSRFKPSSNQNPYGVTTDTGSTKVEITGTAQVHIVQGGSRQGTATVSQTDVILSGRSNVSYMACGSVSDGNILNEGPVVGSSRIEIKDGASVGKGREKTGLLLGGGWDIWTDPVHPSTGKTEVVISGGTVYGDVYGGGFRGSVGKDMSTETTVTISSTGGRITGSVYGGGCGGKDPFNNSLYRMGKAFVNGNISMSLSGETIIEGNVYGGGCGYYPETGTGRSDELACATVYGNVNLNVNCRVDGSVFGGGKGVQFGNDGTENLNKEKVANVCGSISLSVDPGKGIGGTVYGAGEYGHVGGEGENIHVSIKSGKIGGDVFCGGLGESGRNATTTAVSKLSIDGAEIAGSVYGGSKFGNDNIPSGNTKHETNSDSKGSINIYVISGDIRGNTSGNVYGGGYKGYTNSDVHIEIGSPGATSSQKQLRINSIFGGSSVGEYTGTQEVHLYGDTDIIIHPNADSKNQVISGDVFGSGDYCDIGGRSSVRFDGFVQDEPLLSIQKVDDLLISDSRMTLAGTVDGSIQEMTSRLSLNLIDTLTLEAGADVGSKLILMAESSQISNLVSEGGEEGKYNTLSIRNGMMFSILGKKNAGGEDVKRIQGDIAIDNGGSDESDYYGAVILGKTEAADKFEQHFWVEKAGKYIEASYFDKSIMLGGTSSDIELRVWYLQGAFKIEKVVILDAADYTNISQSILTEKVSVTLPRVTENLESNKLFLASFFIREDASGTLILGLKTGLNENNSGDVLNVKANEIDLLELGSGKDCSVDVLDVSVSTHNGFKSNGYRGTIVMHFVEYRGEIPISVFDFELSIYLKMVTYEGVSGTPKIQEFKETLVIRGSEGSWYAQRDIYLPIHGSSILKYVIESVSINEGDVTGWKGHQSINAYAVATNVGRTGWMDTMHSTNPLVLTESTENEWIGTGGITPPVVRLAFEFRCDNHPDSDSEILLVVNATDEITGESWKYLIVVMFTKAPNVEITFFDRYLIENENRLEWKEYSKEDLPTPVLEATMEYGGRLSDAYVAISKNNAGYEFKLPISDDGFTGSYYLYEEESKVLLSNKDELSKILGPRESDYNLELLTEVIKCAISGKKFMISEDKTYDYGYYRFSDSKNHPTEINLDNAVTSNRNIHLHYGVNVSIVPKLEDGTKVDGDATPSSFISNIPGQSISLENLAVPPKGYELKKWQDGNGTVIDEGYYLTPYSSNAKLFMIVEPRNYSVSFNNDFRVHCTLNQANIGAFSANIVQISCRFVYSRLKSDRWPEPGLDFHVISYRMPADF